MFDVYVCACVYKNLNLTQSHRQKLTFPPSDAIRSVAFSVAPIAIRYVHQMPVEQARKGWSECTARNAKMYRVNVRTGTTK